MQLKIFVITQAVHTIKGRGPNILPY